jgi:hypothetical protein
MPHTTQAAEPDAVKYIFSPTNRHPGAAISILSMLNWICSAMFSKFAAAGVLPDEPDSGSRWPDSI